MRQKILYLSFLFIMVILLVLLNRKPKVVQPVVEEPSQQQIANKESGALLGDDKLLSLSSDKAGVVFVKKAQKKSPSEESFLPAAKSSFRADTPTQNSGSSGESRIEPSNKNNDADKDESSGITKISKHPSEERKQQLANDGILIF